MTEDQINQFIAKVRAAADDDDDEVAHSKEDELMVAFIRHVSAQGGELGRLADIVLATQDLDFARWCA